MNEPNQIQQADATDWKAIARVQSAKLAAALDEPGALARLQEAMRSADWKQDSTELPDLPDPVDLLQVMWRGDREFCRPVGDYFTADQMRSYARAAQPPAAGPVETDRVAEPKAAWRLLTRSDTIEQGDESLNDDCETWRPVGPGICIGMPYEPNFFQPIRRRVSA